MVASCFTVEQGHVLTFGRAVGDTRPGRTDLGALDPRAPVPPTFVAASVLHNPEHMRGLRPAGPLAVVPPGGADGNGGGAVLHAEQHFEYHAPVRVGDVLAVEQTDGRTWEKESRRGGLLRFREIRTDYRRPDGALSVRARMVLVGQRVPDHGSSRAGGAPEASRGDTTVRREAVVTRPRPQPQPGDRRRAVVCPQVTRTQIMQFACATGDLSPLHVDEPHAVAAGYPSVMAHGMLTMAATANLLTGWWGEESLASFGVRFLAPVWPGDELTAAAVVTAVRDAAQGALVDLDVATTNQSGVAVLTGTATARLESRRWRDHGAAAQPEAQVRPIVTRADEEVRVPESRSAQVVKRLMAAFSAQDRAEIEAVLAEDCVWRVPGRNALAGEYVGRGEVFGLFGRLRKTFDGPARFDVIDIAESDDRAISFQYGIVTVAGRELRMKECLVYRLRGGKVVEVDEFQYDQAAFDATFTADVVPARR